MNQEERDWLEWLKRVQGGVVTQRQAAEKMGVSDRWVRKLLLRMKTDGDGVVVHGLRGRSSNRRIDEQTQARAVELLKQPEWYDFGPTFASQQLAGVTGLIANIALWLALRSMIRAEVERQELRIEALPALP